MARTLPDDDTRLPFDERMAERRKRRDRIDRLDKLATALDARFRIPGLGLPVGWDSILGLIPGVGDIVTALPGAAMFYEARRMGARRRAALRIALNTGVDLALGAIPIVGDAFDLVFKSHRRNIAILKDELARIEASETNGQSGTDFRKKKEQRWQSDKDPKMEAATPNGFSEKRVPLGSRADLAVRSSATSQAGTNSNDPTNARRARRG